MDYPPTPPRKRDCLTPTQLATLVIFRKYDLKICKRPKRPTLSEVALELGGMHYNGAYGHVIALERRGMVEQVTSNGKHRPWELTDKGRARADKKMRDLARAERKKLERQKRKAAGR